jgi:hypothetical protein
MADKKKHPQVEQWMADQRIKDFLTQAHTDIFVGLRHGEGEGEIERAIAEFAEELGAEMRPKWVKV